MSSATAHAKPEKRESPTYVNMGLDGEMLMRLEKPVRRELEALYEEVYGALDTPEKPAPRPGMGKFIGFAASVGADEIRRRFLRPEKPPARRRAPR